MPVATPLIGELMQLLSKSQVWKNDVTCAICLDKIKLGPDIALATCACACKMVSHQLCLQSYHTETGTCPTCNCKVGLKTNTVKIWADATKLDLPMKKEVDIHEVYGKVFHRLVKLPHPMSTLIQLNADAYKLTAEQTYTLLPMGLMLPYFKCDSSVNPLHLAEFGEMKLAVRGSAKTFASLYGFLTVNPHYDENLKQLLKIDAKYTLLESIENNPDIILSGASFLNCLISNQSSSDAKILNIDVQNNNNLRQNLDLLLLSFSSSSSYEIIIAPNLIMLLGKHSDGAPLLVKINISEWKTIDNFLRNFSLSHLQCCYLAGNIWMTVDCAISLRNKVSFHQDFKLQNQTQIASATQMGLSIMHQFTLSKDKYTSVKATNHQLLAICSKKIRLGNEQINQISSQNIGNAINFCIENYKPTIIDDIDTYGLVIDSTFKYWFPYTIDNLTQLVEEMRKKSNKFLLKTQAEEDLGNNEDFPHHFQVEEAGQNWYGSRAPVVGASSVSGLLSYPVPINNPSQDEIELDIEAVERQMNVIVVALANQDEMLDPLSQQMRTNLLSQNHRYLEQRMSTLLELRYANDVEAVEDAEEEESSQVVEEVQSEIEELEEAPVNEVENNSSPVRPQRRIIQVSPNHIHIERS
jgi:hypothetical protein